MGVEFTIDVKRLSLNDLLLGQISTALGLPSTGGFLAAKALIKKSGPKKMLSAVRKATAPTHVRFVAILDSRTTDICKHYGDDGGKVWPIGSPNIKEPPLHWNSVVKGSKITTSKGIKNIEDIKIGDMVLTHNDRYMPVTNVMRKKPDTKTLKLVNNFGESITLSKDHPVLTSLGWKIAGDVKAGDMLFQNLTQFSKLGNWDSRPCIKHAVLIDSHDIVTSFTEEFIPCDIGFHSAVMPSSVKLNNCIINNKISNILSNWNLKVKSYGIALKKMNKLALAKGRVCLVSFTDSFRPFFHNTFHTRGVVFGGSLGGFSNKLFPVFNTSGLPIFRTFQSRNVNTVSNDAISFTSRLKTILYKPFRNSTVRNIIFSFQKSKALTCAHVLFVKFCSLFKSHNDLHVEYYSTCSCTSTVEVDYNDYMYNLSIDEDETFIADSYLVHNCRSSLIYFRKES